MYPDRDENWCVDDGYGWLDPGHDHPETRRYTFIAYYNHYHLWYGGRIAKALEAFSQAYLYTNDSRYAAAGTILLDRIADVYPDMDSSVYLWKDGFRNSHGLTGLGKIVGSIWETGLAASFVLAYDALFPGMDSPEITAFLSLKTKQYPMLGEKDSVEAVRRNIEQGILMQVKPAIEAGQILGNVGMHQSALALAAVVLDHPTLTKEWIDFLFETHERKGRPLGNILTILVNDVDRDGHGDEASPAYNSGWLGNLKLVADALSGQGERVPLDLYDYPKFRKLFHMLTPYVMLGKYTPSIGDTKRAGDPGIIGSADLYVSGFAKTGDPLLARFAYFLNGNQWEGLRGDIFTDNEAVLDEMKKAVDRHGPFEPGSCNTTGYGFAALRDGKGDFERALTLYYGRNTGHGHKDTLNIGIYAYGMDLSPDHGYPCFADGNYERKRWTINTISHNTVVVDRSPQSNQVVAVPHHFEGGAQVQLIDVEAPQVYPHTRLYRRTTAMVRVDDEASYLLDLFRVKGGSEHLYSFHGPEGEALAEGLQLEKQAAGTYAGEMIAYADPEYDMASESGFNYLYDVERDSSPPSGYSVDWKAKDTWGVKSVSEDVHLRLTMVSAVDEVIIAQGEPPQNKPGNPKSYTYMLARREGEALESQFVSVLEAYKGESRIKRVEAVAVKAEGELSVGCDAAAVKITFANGRTDYLFQALHSDKLYVVDDFVEVKGFFGMCSIVNGSPTYGYVCDGTILRAGGSTLIDRSYAALTGSVTGFTKDLSLENEISVHLDQPIDDIRLGRGYIYIQNDGIRNAAYEFTSLKPYKDGGLVVEIGDVTTIRAWADKYDFSRGYEYDLQEGDPFRIPLSYEWRAEE
ncbi:heparinase II/III-family protein [Paenibacillus sp. CC-CFT747]|nr:heparinase II/III-family protein [Paenibacillus sp. CC-CFT747]